MPHKWQDQELKQLKALALEKTALGTQPNWPAIADAYMAHPGPTPEGVVREKDAVMQQGRKHWKKVGLGCAALKCCADATHSAFMQEWAHFREAEVSGQEGTAGTAYTPDVQTPGM